MKVDDMTDDGRMNKLADDVFDEFMMNRACEAAKFADFITILNMKARENVENPQKMSMLTEILNDLKLYIEAPHNDRSH